MTEAIEEPIYGEVVAFRSLFYVTFKSNKVLRWIAREFRNEYCTLNRSVWRRIGYKGDPKDSIPLRSNIATYHFHTREQAEAALREASTALKSKM